MNKKKPLSTHYQYFKRWLSSFFWLEPCAGGIITRERQGTVELLCIAHQKGVYTLPKGKGKIGESIEQTAIREIQEETGLYGFKLGPIVGTIRDRKRRKKITFYEIKNPSTRHSPLRDEAIIWVPLYEAMLSMRHTEERKLLKKIFITQSA